MRNRFAGMAYSKGLYRETQIFYVRHAIDLDMKYNIPLVVLAAVSKIDEEADAQ